MSAGYIHTCGVTPDDRAYCRGGAVELLQRLATLHPDLPCILVSGYGIPQLAALGA